MSTSPRPTEGIRTAPGPPVRFAHTVHHDPIAHTYIPYTTGKPEDPSQTDILDLYDEEAQRQAWEDAVHLQEMDIEMKKAAQRVVPGVDNEDLEALLRSFDKQIQTVHSIPPAYDADVPPDLDLHPSPEAEFSIDGMRTALERLYTTAVVGILRTVHEVQRIRYWQGGGYRTMVALALYTYAWLNERIILGILLFGSLLILVPSARTYLFAETPFMDSNLAELDPADPIRIAYEREHNPWGAAATETSARNWANAMIDAARSLSQPGSGHSQAEKVQGEVQSKVDSRMKASMDKKKRGSLNLEDRSGFGANAPEVGEKERDMETDWEDKEHKEKVSEMYLQPTMRVLQGLADKYERLGNALDPSPPWATQATQAHRGTVAAYLIPLLVLSILVSERMVSRAIGLAFGVFLFGRPMLVHLTLELDRLWPTWKIDLVLRWNILQDVPNNAQLMLRLLRQAEHNQHPLPYDPKLAGTLDSLQDDSDVDMGVVENGSSDTSSTSDRSSTGLKGLKGAATNIMGRTGHRMHTMADSGRAKVRSLWDRIGERKEEGTAIVTGHRQLDYAGKAENILDKLHIRDTKIGQKVIDKLPSVAHIEYPQRADRFYVWHKSHGAGHLILYPPCPPLNLGARIEFTTLRPDLVSQTLTTTHDAQLIGADHAYHDPNRTKIQREAGTEPVAMPTAKQAKENLILPVNCIVGLKKTGLVFPARVAVGWALAAEGAGGTGLDITFVRPGSVIAAGHPVEGGCEADGGKRDGIATVAQGKEEVVKLSGIVRRDELYRRLVAIGDQRWEVF